MSKFRKINSAVDSNQKDIIDILETIPALAVKTGHDDILVGFRGRNYWFEIKNPDSINKKTGDIKESWIREGQKKIKEEWRGQYDIVTSLDEILHIIGVVKNGIKT